jgi:hypothetical protein
MHRFWQIDDGVAAGVLTTYSRYEATINKAEAGGGLPAKI